MTERTIVCALADDDRVEDVVATARALGACGAFRPLFVHVADPAIPASTAVGLAPALGAAGAAARIPRGTLEDSVEAVRRLGAELLASAGIDDDESLLVTGDPVTELRRTAAEHDAAFIVVGTHGRGVLSSALLGSVSRALAREGDRPVMLTRGGPLPTGGGPVVCAVDLADERCRAVAWQGAELAAALERPLVLAHVLRLERLAATAGAVPAPVAVEPTDEERDRARSELEDLARATGLRGADCVLLEGAPPSSRLDEFAAGRQADLLVVGCRGGGFLRTAFEGSVSLDLTRHGRRPLVVVPLG